MSNEFFPVCGRSTPFFLLPTAEFPSCMLSGASILSPPPNVRGLGPAPLPVFRLGRLDQSTYFLKHLSPPPHPTPPSQLVVFRWFFWFFFFFSCFILVCRAGFPVTPLPHPFELLLSPHFGPLFPSPPPGLVAAPTLIFVVPCTHWWTV